LPFFPIKLKKAMGTDMQIQTENFSGIVHFIRGEKAILVNIAIMRAFVQLRKFIETNKELVVKIGELEKMVSGHDENIRLIFETIGQLIEKKNELRTPVG